jgi:hypothetical protein
MSSRQGLADEDESRECAVLSEVLRLHPTSLTVTELVRLMGVVPAAGFADVDPWKRAIRELCGCGLLRQEGQVIAPTIAAVRFSELFEVP